MRDAVHALIAFSIGVAVVIAYAYFRRGAGAAQTASTATDAVAGYTQPSVSAITDAVAGYTPSSVSAITVPAAKSWQDILAEVMPSLSSAAPEPIVSPVLSGSGASRDTKDTQSGTSSASGVSVQPVKDAGGNTSNDSRPRVVFGF
jgi:hypothetical protein